MLRILQLTTVLLALGAALPVGAETPVPGVAAPAPGTAAGEPPAPAASAPAPSSDAAPRAPLPPRTPELDADRPGWAEPPPDSEGLLGALLRMALVLGLVLGLIYLTLNVGLRRLMNVAPSRNALIKVHERVSLEPKRSVYLVEAAGEYLLLGVGERDVNLIAKLDRDPTRAALDQKVERAAQAPRPFWDRLAVKPTLRKQPPGGSKS